MMFGSGRSIRKCAAFAAVLSLIPLLAACGKSDAEKATEDHEQCVSYGAKPGSDAYIQCRATLHFSRLKQEQQEASSMMSAAAVSLAIHHVGASRR